MENWEDLTVILYHTDNPYFISVCCWVNSLKRGTFYSQFFSNKKEPLMVWWFSLAAGVKTVTVCSCPNKLTLLTPSWLASSWPRFWSTRSKISASSSTTTSSTAATPGADWSPPGFRGIADVSCLICLMLGHDWALSVFVLKNKAVRASVAILSGTHVRDVQCVKTVSVAPYWALLLLLHQQGSLTLTL